MTRSQVTEILLSIDIALVTTKVVSIDLNRAQGTDGMGGETGRKSILVVITTIARSTPTENIVKKKVQGITT